MAAKYPDEIADTTYLPNNRTSNTPTSSNHTNDHNRSSDEIIAIETELGVNPKGEHASVVARLDDVDSRIDNGAGVASRPFYVDAIALKPSTADSAPATFVEDEDATSGITFDHIAFASNEVQHAEIRFRWPEDWGGSTVDVKFAWYAPAGSTVGEGVALGAALRVLKDGVAYGGTLGTRSTVTDAVIGTGRFHTTTPLSVSAGATLTADDLIVLDVSREVANVADDMNLDLWLIGVYVGPPGYWS